MAKNKSRKFITIGVAIVLAAGIAAAFWPRASEVDIASVSRGEIIVTINEEARTRVRNAFVVSAPVVGRLQRVSVKPGDLVVKGETVLAILLPTNPGALDARTREQAQTAVAAAEATLRAAQADLVRAEADRDQVASDLDRSQKLFNNGTVSQAALDRATSQMRISDANVETASAAISMHVANLRNTEVQLISFEDPAIYAAIGDDEAHATPITAPASGRVLRVIQQSETTLVAGTPIMEIGDTENDLEVVVELLSTDAVRVKPGDRVIIENWGGDMPLEGNVERIDPWGFTKYSALGIEEQRVNTIIQFAGSPADRVGLGHGYRVEARIVMWEQPDALIIPSSALFREADDWAVFTVREGRAVIQTVSIGQNNGLKAELLDGLNEGDLVVLFPSSNLEDGAMVKQRELN